jgi:phosphonate transport system substrate-binding protein
MFGVLNQQSPIQTAERWNPILRYLTKKTGIPLQLKIGATVEKTDAMMGREEFDLVFTNHNFQTEFDGKYKVLVRWAGNPIHGALVVHEDSAVKSLSDLQGKIVGFPSPEAFVAYAVPMVALKDAKVSVFEKFAGSQDGALAQLKARQVEAAAINTRFLGQYAKQESLRYRIIYQSEPFHELPIVVHPRVAAEKVAALKQALLELAHDPLAAEIRARQCPGFEMTEEHEYDNVRRVYRMIGQ